VKSAPAAFGQINAFFAGALSEDKGVGDCLEAVQLLKTRNIRLGFRFAGAGDTAAWQARAQALGIGDQVAFLGIIANEAVRAEMRHSDLVIIPSRHSYAEGLPNTLIEGLTSRTPVICSDHPAFADRLRNGVDVLMFQGASAPALADAVQRLSLDAGLYTTLSANAAAAYKGLFFGTDWAELIRLFLNDPQNRTGWVKDRSLKALLQARAAANHGT
jgi:glycosyltransferase involved in cell wall biosynthesis